jgi:hypothetical protein
MVHTAITTHATSRTFFLQIFLGSSRCLGLGESNCNKYHSTEERQSLFTNHKRLGDYKRKQGAVHVYSLTLKPHSYELCGVLDTGPGSLLCLYDVPLHHRIKGDLGILALKTCQHMLHHYLR